MRFNFFKRKKEKKDQINNIIYKKNNEESINSINKEINNNIKNTILKQEEFTIDNFLKSIGNLDNISALMLLKKIYYLGKENKNKAFQSQIIIDKLHQGLLKDSPQDQYRYYREMMRYITPKEIFSLYDIEYLKQHFNDKKNGYEYKFFACLCEKNINETISCILKDDSLFNEFFKYIDNFYSLFNNLDYVLLRQIIFKLEENNLNYSLIFLSSCSTENQISLLNEDFKDATILKILGYSHEKSISNFFENNKRGAYLYREINVAAYLKRGVKFSDDIVKNKDFFDELKRSSFVEFRNNINLAEKNCNPSSIEERLNDYYKELLEDYDRETKIFKKYEIIFDEEKLLKTNLLTNYIFSSYKFYKLRDIIKNNSNKKEEILDILKDITSIKLTEIIIDALFKDNYYNVCINIKEMLRFNDTIEEQPLTDDRIRFYKSILEFDKIDNNIKIDIYNKLKDKNYNLIFYEDLRKLKNLSYDKIKEKMLNFERDSYELSEKQAKKYGVNIYDFRNKEYTMLVRKISEFYEKTHLVRGCYSLVSNENNNVFCGEADNGFIYGYNTFDNDNVLHVLETDSFSSSDKEKSTRFVNRIMTPKEIVNSDTGYSEIQIVNSKNTFINNSYKAIKPNYLVAFDSVNPFQIDEAKRLNIPIVIIARMDLNEKNKINIGLSKEDDTYIEESYYENIRKRIRDK